MAKVNLKSHTSRVKTSTRRPVTAKGTKTIIKRDKLGNVKSVKTDYTRRAVKSQSLKTKAQLTKEALELEKVKSNNAAKIAIAGEAGATVTGSVGTGVGYSAINQQVNGGMSDQGGLGRDEANSNNSGENSNSWEDIIGNLGKARKY